MKSLVVAIITLSTLAIGSRADAFPHFQFSSDTNTCNLCHYAPAGGGMLTDWGREEAADTLSRGGDGSALHGLVELPDWLGLHSDIRLAGLAKDNDESQGTQFLIFPMQADLTARIQKGGILLVSRRK